MKKVIGQTVRDLKRGVNKKVLKVPGIEQKVLDATNNEAWGPHGALLADLAKASLNFHEHQMIMNVIWKRINDTGKNWRHVYKALTVLEYLMAHGSERVIDEIREHAYQLSTLSNFQYVDSSGRDQGSNIRRKSQILVALVNDKERIQELRQKANANRDKYQSTGPAGSTYKPGYGDRYDDDNREGRYGYKDDERNGSERERDDGYRSDDRYGRGRESYGRDGDRYGRDHDEQNGRDGYRNDDYGGRGTDESRGSVDRYTDRSADDDDRYSTKSGGGRGDGHSHDERRLEQHLSEDNFGGPPSYEEATKNVQNDTLKERDDEAVVSPKDESTSHAAPKPNSSREVASQSPNHAAYSESPAAPSVEVDAFDEFDPRGSVSASLPRASSPELDFFGSLSASDSRNSLALMPAISASTSEAVMPVNSDFGMDFAAPSATSNFSCETSENPFGDPPFKATPGDSYQAQPQNFTSVHSTQVSNASVEVFPSNMGTVPGFDFGDMLGGLSYTSQAGDGQHYSSTAAFSAPDMPLASESNDILDGILPRTDSATNISSQTTEHAAPNNSHFHEPGPPAMFPSQEHSISSQATQPAGTSNMQPSHLNFLQQGVSAPSQTAPSSSQAAQPPIPDNMKSSHPNFPQQQGVPVPASLPPQTTPVSSQAAQPTNTNSTQLDHLNFLPQGVSAAASVPSQEAPVVQAAQPTDASNMQSAQFNFFEQPGSSSSQSVQLAAPNNMQLDHFNNFDQPTFSASAPFSSQAVQSAAPGNFQSTQLNPKQQAGVPTPLPLQGAPTTFGPPANVQPNNMQLDHFNDFQQPAFSASIPFSSQAAQPPAPSTIQAAQLNPVQQAGVPTPPPLQGAPTKFGPPTEVQPNNTQLDHFNNFQQRAFSASVPFSSQAAQPPAPGNIQATQLSPLQQAGVPKPPALHGAPSTFGPPAKAQPVKFEPKSTVWADTLNRGLVDLNISGPKTNPLSDIGVDFDSINRKEKRMEARSSSAPVTSTITMGKAMGAGSGIGRSGATGVPPAPNPMVASSMGMGRGANMGMGAGMGMGMGGGANMGMNMGMGGYGSGMNQPPMGMNMGGYGGGMNQPSMSMNMGGYGGGMNQPSMGMNMGMGQGAQMQPPTGMPPPAAGMPGFGYNPMMGMNNYGSQQQNGGAAPQQQPFGGGYR